MGNLLQLMAKHWVTSAFLPITIFGPLATFEHHPVCHGDCKELGFAYRIEHHFRMNPEINEVTSVHRAF